MAKTLDGTFSVVSHEHVDEKGKLHKCYHYCKDTIFTWKFWLVTVFINTFDFLPEHLIWFKLWPFKLLSKALNLS